MSLCTVVSHVTLLKKKLKLKIPDTYHTLLWKQAWPRKSHKPTQFVSLSPATQQ